MAKVKIRRTTRPWQRRVTKSGWIVWTPPGFEGHTVTEILKHHGLAIQLRGRTRTVVITWLEWGAYHLTDLDTGLGLIASARGQWTETHTTLKSALQEACRYVVTAHAKEG